MNKDFRRKLVEQINEQNKKYKLVKSEYGHYYINPMPTEKELQRVYAEKYFSSAVEVSSKGMDVGLQDEKERFHYDRQYAETVEFAESNFSDKSIRILDVGCGMGGLLKYLKAHGYYNLYGTEIDASQTIKDVEIFKGHFLEFDPDNSFDFIVFNNVLEHVRNPEIFLQKAHKLLNDGGCVRIQVPNDLSYTQYKSIEGKKNENYYFFCPPEHLHYFDFESLKNMLKKTGFKIVKRMTNWPMDLFILMGIDYSEDPKMGKLCHNYRLNFEYKMQYKFLLDFYEKMAQLEIGRVVIEYAKKL